MRKSTDVFEVSEGSGELSYNNAFGYMGVFNLEYNLPSWYQNFPGKTGRRVPSMVGYKKKNAVDLPDLEYHDLQCGAPQLCLLVYKPHENYSYKYHKP